MRINEIKVYQANIPRRFPFKTAKAVQYSVDDVFLEIRTNGLIGIGETVPREHVTGETQKGTFNDTRDYAKKILGMDSLEALSLVYLDNLPPSTKLCLEGALMDLVAQENKVPICDMMQKNNVQQIQYMVFVNGDMQGTKLSKKAQKIKKQGYSIARMKVGSLSFEEDYVRVRQLREQLGKGIGIWLDVNQGWNFEDAKRYIKALEEFNVMMVEQPLDQKDFEGHRELKNLTKIPLMLDESIQNAADLEKTIEKDYSRAVNLKPMKLGSFIETRKLAAKALQAGLDVYCGGTICTDIFAAYSRHMEFALPGGKYFTTGIPRSHTFKENPTEPKLKWASKISYVTRPKIPGLGIKINHAVFDKHVTSKEILN